MALPKNLFRKLWLDGRTGTTNYLLIFLAMMNFILISYNFLIEENPLLNIGITDMWIFVIIFVALYFPVSVLIGRWHTYTQLSTDVTIKMLREPLIAKMIRVLLDVQTGKATKEEIEEFRKMLQNIERNIDEF